MLPILEWYGPSDATAEECGHGKVIPGHRHEARGRLIDFYLINLPTMISKKGIFLKLLCTSASLLQ